MILKNLFTDFPVYLNIYYNMVSTIVYIFSFLELDMWACDLVRPMASCMYTSESFLLSRFEILLVIFFGILFMVFDTSWFEISLVQVAFNLT